ncbi:hypothetical protein H9651_12590 [Microbacterium sp. Sa4CUA7]|uniref:Transposase DDE domain-containing protein n=1 Tax=Microbacterium pullorum TaxID=2762236 RepID=A0ABR8S4R5_9MICO|nr:hypothetical protein [Microbacterium pullorum]MBD7958479.1 hypothetical protein [Microbacterium pullorum]
MRIFAQDRRTGDAGSATTCDWIAAYVHHKSAPAAAPGEECRRRLFGPIPTSDYAPPDLCIDITTVRLPDRQFHVKRRANWPNLHAFCLLRANHRRDKGANVRDQGAGTEIRVHIAAIGFPCIDSECGAGLSFTKYLHGPRLA